MRSRVFLSAILSLSMALPSLASPKDDVTYVAQQILSPENLTQAKSSVAAGYAAVYAEYLKQKSVRLLNRQAFAQMIPVSDHDPWMDVMKDDVLRCLSRFSEKEIGLAAHGMRWLQEEQSAANSGRAVVVGTVNDGQSVLNGLTRQVETTTRVISKPGFAEAVKASMCIVNVAGIAQKVMRDAKVSPGDDLSFLADILLVDGIAQFPNRIVRNNVIEDLRASANRSLE